MSEAIDYTKVLINSKELAQALENQIEALDEWQTLKAYPNYEIHSKYPYELRKKGSSKVIKEYVDKTGYVKIHLTNKDSGKQVLATKQKILKSQWYYNPDETIYTDIDHIDTIKTNNHLSNLRLVTHSQNNLNRSGLKGVKYNFLEELPEDAIGIWKFNNWHFRNYYYSKSLDKFYLDTGIKFRELHTNLINKRSPAVSMKDINGAIKNVLYEKFKRSLQ